MGQSIADGAAVRNQGSDASSERCSDASAGRLLNAAVPTRSFNGVDGTRRAFFDHDLIAGMGLGSVNNIRGSRCLGR